tara:strand:+ start:5657 stop:6703 length:1047 start_codon:yes stop_codon:yes gene_type:complete
MKSTLQPLVDQFMPYAQKRMGFNKLPRIFLRDDPHNAQNPLGKTAYYDPAQMSVTLYVTGRHPKDVMRSLSHELIHHTQNCNGQFDGASEMGEGYAQNDEHLREMERQAYEQGNLVFRDWEDSIKGTIYNESLQKGAKKKMSLKDWKNNELRTVLSERWGFSFNLLSESQEEEPVDEAKIPVTKKTDSPDFHIRRELKMNPDATRQELVDAVMENIPMSREKSEAAVDKHLSGEKDIEEGAASSGRVVTPDRGGEDRRANDERKRPMEEAEKPDFPDVDGDGDREEPISKASKEKKDDKGGDKEEKSDKDVSKVPPQLRKHVKGKMDEQKIRRIIRKLVKEAMAKKAK